MLVRGPLGPLDIICANHVANGLTRDSRGSMNHDPQRGVGSKYVDQVLDSLYVIEMAIRHFFIRAEMGKDAGRKNEEIDGD
jgi:hypothetical protein